MKKIFAALLLLLTGCTGIPENVRPVEHFNLEKYLGKWFEIARLDHSFERGLTHVSATYSLREDGDIRVLNRGYSAQKKKWQEAEGKASFVGRTDQGHLKVSFFGPFYSSYIIIELDHAQYQYALVCGPDRSYLWLLARTPALSPEVKNHLIAQAASLGFDTSALIFVDQHSQPLSSRVSLPTTTD